MHRQHDERAWIAWHTAYLPRAKRPVKLRDMQTERKNKRHQSSEEQLSIAYAWHAFFNKTAAEPQPEIG